MTVDLKVNLGFTITVKGVKLDLTEREVEELYEKLSTAQDLIDEKRGQF